MKKKMQKPEIEFIEFNTTDVITTSGGMDAKGKEGTGGYGVVTAFVSGGLGQPLQ